jgi:hypothetical protein
LPRSSPVSWISHPCGSGRRLHGADERGEDAGLVVELARGIDAADAPLRDEDGAALLLVERAHPDEDLSQRQGRLLGRAALGLEGEADLVERGEAVLEQQPSEGGGVGVERAGALEFEEAAHLAGGEDAAPAGDLAERRAEVPGLFEEQLLELIGTECSVAQRQDPEQMKRSVRHRPGPL